MFREHLIDRVVTLVLDHGPVNAMDLEFCEAVIRRLQQIQNDPELEAVVLRGKERVFSAGIDLKRWLAAGPEYVEPFLRGLEELFDLVFLFRKPILAVIGGHAIAGGCMLAAACDFRLISNTAKMGILESRLGVPLPMMAIEIIRFVACRSAFRRIIGGGATFVGEQAVDVGLADVCGTQLEPLISRAIEELTALPGPAFELTKWQARRPTMRVVEDNRHELFARYLKIWQSQQTRDAIEAYVARRLS